jgi:mRNA-degrading endonuclease YafQ of YafQ-DinJ toxin-antitoxin module
LSTNNSVKITYGEMWKESLALAAKDSPNILTKINEFIQFKQQDPLANFGNSDRNFTSSGIYKQFLPKARKAHLNLDISIVYELSGKNPTIIKLYGVFSHAQLGTGQPANIKRQKKMAKKISTS